MIRPWLLASLVLAGCVSPLASLKHSRTLTLDEASITVRWGPDDEETQLRMNQALARAVPELERWGKLPAPVTLSLLPSHDALEAVTGRHGYGWLRAWGTFDEIFLQSPRSWSVPPRDADLSEWLLHELTHCLLFQRSGTAETWSQLQIPLWFREGMATVTARQGYRYPSLEDLANWLAEHPDFDVFTNGEALSQHWFDQVYGLAHHAMTFLIRRYGDAPIARVMNRLQAGDEFDQAFTNAVGISPSAFAREFRNYLRLRGFRGFGLQLRGSMPSQKSLAP